ncbi:MAG: ABC transporter permease [Clostridiales bacterium]|jgi:simple sugar transport system permease protein|nr:ABC transporter permease [Clostridiales bacterium]
MKTNVRRIALKSEVLSLLLIVLLCIAFSIANPAFFHIINILDLLKVCSYPTIFACGVMIVLISGGLDMSFMWIGMFSAYSTSKMLSLLQVGQGIVMPLPVIFAISTCIGALLGSFNALLVSKFRLPVFIATLSSANIFMGVMFQFIGSEYIFPAQMPVRMIEFSKTLLFTTQSADGTPVGLHASVLVAAGVCLVVHFIMRYTLVGRSVYCIGGDEAAAERVGFSRTRTRLFIFMLAGAIAGLAGIVGVSNIQVANPYDFQNRELTVTAAVVIGGTRITGGSGSVIGVVLGVILTNIISQNLVLIGVQPEYSKFVFGILVLFAATVQGLQTKLRNRK